MYAIFQGCFAPAMPQMYASARESINVNRKTYSPHKQGSNNNQFPIYISRI
jgi:hypothetical protein